MILCCSQAAKGAHAVCILTEWDEFKILDWKKVYDVSAAPFLPTHNCNGESAAVSKTLALAFLPYVG
jgi:hypothetical protein